MSTLYIPKQFAEHDRAKLFDLMQAHNFATLITAVDNTPHITHLPFIVEPGQGPNGTLFGHFARGNPHWKSLRPGNPATVIFQGPHSYISPRWYRDRSNVPTWNYVTVHVTGPIELMQDKPEVLDIVSRLTGCHEQGAQNPWPVTNAEKNLDKLLSAIVGFRLPIHAMEGKFKLSQNRSVADQMAVIDELAQSSDPSIKGVAHLMRCNLNPKN